MRFSLACAFALSVTASTVLAQIPYSWSYNRLIAPSPLETVIALSFGVPETDQQQASIQCSIGANWIYAAVDLGADVEGLEDGASATVVLNPGARDFVEVGTVFRHEEGIWGVSLALALDDPFWAELNRGDFLSYRVNDRAPDALPLGGIGGPLRQFLGDCTAIAEGAPATSGGQPTK